MAELHFDLHQIKPDAPNSQHQTFRDDIESTKKLTQQQKKTILGSLAKMPEGNSVCHYDLHPENIIISTEGPVIIDWMNVHIGNPMADVAKSWVMIMGVFSPDFPVPQFLKPIWPLVKLQTKMFLKRYLTRYFELCPGREAEFAAWKPIVAAATLIMDITMFDKMFLKIVSESFLKTS